MLHPFYPGATPLVTAQRKKRKEKKIKIPTGPTCQSPISLSSLFCAAARTRRRRRPSSGHVPAILVRRAQPSLLSSLQDPERDRPRSPPQTLAFPSSIAVAPKPCRHRLPPRFSRSGELWLNPSLGELLLALLLRFRRSHGLHRLPAGPPPLSSARRRPCPSHRPLVAAPRLCHRR